MVMMSPQTITMNSAPAARRTSRMLTTCPEGAPPLACTQQGFTDVTFGLETNYGALAVVGLEARRGVGGSFLAGAGVLGGFDRLLAEVRGDREDLAS